MQTNNDDTTLVREPATTLSFLTDIRVAGSLLHQNRRLDDSLELLLRDMDVVFH